MYQAWIQLKNLDKIEVQEVKFESMVFNLSTGENEPKNMTIDFEVPQWDNVICTLRFKEANPLRVTGLESGAQAEPEVLLPADDIKLEQTCGYQLLSMYDTVTYDQVGKGPESSQQVNSCTNWNIVEDKTGFRGDDRVEAICTFRRPFKAEMQQSLYDSDGNPKVLDFISGFNIYYSDKSDYRYIYGWSVDSEYRQIHMKLEAMTSFVGLATLVLSLLLLY